MFCGVQNCALKSIYIANLVSGLSLDFVYNIHFMQFPSSLAAIFLVCVCMCILAKIWKNMLV